MSAFVVLWGEGTLTMGLLWGLSLVRLGTAASAEMSAAFRPFRFWHHTDSIRSHL